MHGFTGCAQLKRDQNAFVHRHDPIEVRVHLRYDFSYSTGRTRQPQAAGSAQIL